MRLDESVPIHERILVIENMTSAPQADWKGKELHRKLASQFTVPAAATAAKVARASEKRASTGKSGTEENSTKEKDVAAEIKIDPSVALVEPSVTAVAVDDASPVATDAKSEDE